MNQSNTAIQERSTELASRSADQKFCFSCGCVLHNSASDCIKCGAQQPEAATVVVESARPLARTDVHQLKPNHVFCRGCSAPLHESAMNCPKCGAPQRVGSVGVAGASGRNRTNATLLAFFLGWVGGHKFYLGQVGLGILYAFFFWTMIPGVIAFIEGIVYLTMSDDEFSRKYG